MRSATPPVAGLARGTFVVSIDTELAWGGAHRRAGSMGPDGTGSSGDAHDYGTEREVIDRILALLDRYGITATWAVVGHLFLDACDGDGDRDDDRPHPEVARPDYAWLSGDWYDVDPRTSAADAPDWYAPDVVDAIAACPTPQEIASHSFSHLIVDDPGCAPEVFGSDLDAAGRAAAARDLELRSFVYPRNAIDHIDELARRGYVAYRGGRPEAPFPGRPAWQVRALRLVDTVRPLRGSAVFPRRHDSGIWNVPQTYLFDPVNRGGRLPPGVWARRPVARLRQAARERSIFHLWFHPYNVTADPDRALAVLGHVCAAADRLRDEGSLAVLPMAGVADQLTGTAGTTGTARA